MISLMEQEAFQVPKILERQLIKNHSLIVQISKIIRKKKINFTQIIGRGSSKNAALFAKYLLETQLNIVTSEADLSIQTIYHSKLNFNNSLVIAISQSGKSPDLIEYLSYAKNNHAITIAIVNDDKSPLAQIAEIVISMHAGKEKAIAATKSFLASLSVLIQLVASITNNNTLLNKLKILPSRLKECLTTSSDIFQQTFLHSKNLFIIARGFFLPIAKEAALKFKETCSIHAEAFSSAEVLHGPMAMVEKNFNSLFFFQNDETKLSTLNTYHKFSSLKTTPFAFLPSDLLEKTTSKRFLITPKSLHPICDPLVGIQTFYPLCARLSILKGKNPDRPNNLSKITKTK